MALWNVEGNIVYSDGALSLDPSKASGVTVSRHSYKVPYSTLGKGAIITTKSGSFHTPSWTKVHPKTTLEDITVDKKPFDEVFVEPQSWEFKSSSSDKTYKVKINAKGNLSCDCWGYIAHRKCKHIKEVQSCIT